MSDILDVQVELYPAILRRLAAGERLSESGDETERLAASLLVADAIEKNAGDAKPVVEKKADVAESNIEQEEKVEEPAPKASSPSARATLDRLMKSFA